MTALQRFTIRALFWRGHDVPEIARRTGWTIRDVEAVLFARVTR